jgi:8-oxo-dGTP pyrophosphatase MutT (NUDIX family)
MTDPSKTTAPLQTPAAPRASATVMIVRDGAKGLEIFMVARDRQVDMATGAVIFPGGKVDADDAAPLWGGLSAPRAPERAYWIAALRETYEESGLLLANAGPSHVDAASAAKINAETRTPLLDGKQLYSAILQTRGLLPAFDRMTPFAHWVTPVTQPKRFETHFFLASAPEGQHAVHDGREAVSSFWMRPSDLLKEGTAGRQTLVPPTRLNLEMLAESGTSVAEAFAAAKARRIVTVMPVSSKTPEGMRLTIPAEAGYKTTELLIKR